MIAGAALLFGALSQQALALDLDWSGQFRAESHLVRNYSGGATTLDPGLANAGGYYVTPSGSKDVSFQTLFMRVRPKVIVNDNVYIKSEWWLGDPIFGFYGNGAPIEADRREWYSTQNRGSVISAQRFWGEFVSDVGTLQVGRAPLHWGLGVVWNSGDGLFDRYQSTGDVVRLISKFGSFSFSPAIVKYSSGNSIGAGTNVTDYSLALKFENPDEDFEGGVNFIRRIGGGGPGGYGRFESANENNNLPTPLPPVVDAVNFNTWDFYARRAIGKFTLAAEVPVITGNLGPAEYKTWALAAEANWKPNETWEAVAKFGQAPGQESIQGNTPDKFHAFYFNPAYRIALIMFNYQLANFHGPNFTNSSSTGGALSPWDNPIVDARYLSFGGAVKADKWRFSTNWTFAKAPEVFGATGNGYNNWNRKFYANGSGGEQSSSLGWEMDYGAKFLWDENFQFGLDLGLFFPGGFWKYSNTGTSLSVGTIFAGVLSAGVSF